MYDQEAFPSALHFHGHALPLTYAYAPGEVHDGITLNLPVALASEVPSAWLEWAIPGLRESKMLELLRSLPKALRRDLMPLPQKVGVLLQEFAPEEGPFARTLSTFLHRQFGVRVPIEAISTAMDSLPAHLRVRIQLMADDQKPLGHARDLDKLRSQLPQTPTPQVQSVSPAWTRATQVWERFSLSDWTLPNLPHHIVVEPSQHPTHPPVLAWPALVLEGNDVHLRLMRSPQLARTANARGVQALAERVLSREFGWLERDLRALTDCASLYSALGTIDELRADAMTHLKRYLLPQNGLEQYTELAFRTVVQHARERLPKLAGRFIQQIRDILTARHHIAQRLRGIAPVNQPAASSPQKLAAKPRRSLTDLSQLDALILAAPLESSIQVPSVFSTGSVAPARKRPENRSKLQQPVGFVSWSDELQRVLPKDFLLRTDYDQLPHLLRYLKALEIRHERATLHPAKEQERRQQLEPYLSALNELEAEASVDHPLDPSFTEGLNHYRWMLAEYRVSLFAQELGTAIPVSPKRLDQQLTVLRSTLG
jgi:ATP-dependent helicase HrpA